MSTQSSSEIILGIDPGLNITGYGLLKSHAGQLQLIEAGVIRSRRTDSLESRLASLYDGLMEVLDAFRPDVVALEELYSHYERPTTAILMGHARGVLCLAVGKHQTPLHHYRATQIKSVMTGNGRAPKIQVQLAVMHHLGLQEIPEPPDIADALAIGICHFFLSRNQATQK